MIMGGGKYPWKGIGRSVLITGLILAIGLTGCGRRGEGDQVVARVDRLDITLADFQTFYRAPPGERNPLDEQIQVLDERLEELIGYKLIQEGGRDDGLHITDDFKRRRERHIKDMLNRLVKQREIVEVIDVTDAEIDSLLNRSLLERHFQHIITMNRAAAQDVKDRLEAGEEWGSVAVIYSRDSEVSLHRGDLGWLAWGEGPFSVYPEMQPIAYQIPVGSWQGPIQVGGEYHFINVLEERPRQRGTMEEERAAARNLIFTYKRNAREQELSNRMWAEGGFHFDEDQFRWLHDKMMDSFRKDPANNPIPELSREDLRRVVVRSDTKPYNVRDLLERVELLSPRERDNPLTLDDWRDRFLEWVMIDQVAAYATSKGYRREPGIMTAGRQFTDSRLYALKLEDLREQAGTVTDEELQEYYEQNQQLFDMPERRQIVEVLVETREQAEELLRRARDGESMELIARQFTIRPDFAERSGRFVPIRRDEFGPLGEAVFETPKDGFGPVVETPLGYSIFQVTQILPPRKIQLEDVKYNLRENLRMERERNIEMEYKAEARKRRRIWKNEELIRQWAMQIVAWRASIQSDSNASAVPPAEK